MCYGCMTMFDSQKGVMMDEGCLAQSKDKKLLHARRIPVTKLYTPISMYLLDNRQSKCYNIFYNT